LTGASDAERSQAVRWRGGPGKGVDAASSALHQTNRRLCDSVHHEGVYLPEV